MVSCHSKLFTLTSKFSPPPPLFPSVLSKSVAPLFHSLSSSTSASSASASLLRTFFTSSPSFASSSLSLLLRRNLSRFPSLSPSLSRPLALFFSALYLKSRLVPAHASELLLPRSPQQPPPPSSKPPHTPTWSELFDDPNIWTPYEIFKAAFNALFLLPLRLVVCALLFAGGWAFSRLALLFHNPQWTQQELDRAAADGVTLPARRPLSKWALRFFGCVVTALSHLLSFSLGFVRVKKSGKIPDVDTCSPIIVCNHISIADALFILHDVLGCPVSKLKISHVPALGSILLAMQSVFVNRSDADSRKQARDEICARATLSALNSEFYYPPIIIFPEGTTTTGVGLLEFKTGAFTPGLPVQPVIVRYPNAYCSPAYQSSAAVSVIRLLTQFVNYAEVVYLPVYYPSPEEVADPELFAENVRTVMAEALGVPKAPYYFDNESLQAVSSLPE